MSGRALAVDCGQATRIMVGFRWRGLLVGRRAIVAELLGLVSSAGCSVVSEEVMV